MRNTTQRPKHIKLTSHPHRSDDIVPIRWGAGSAAERGPVVATLTDAGPRNALGVHSGAYSLSRPLATAAGGLDPVHVPDRTETAPAAPIGPVPQWA